MSANEHTPPHLVARRPASVVPRPHFQTSPECLHIVEKSVVINGQKISEKTTVGALSVVVRGEGGVGVRFYTSVVSAYLTTAGCLHAAQLHPPPAASDSQTR